MALVRMDIQSIVVGAGPVASLIILKPRHGSSSSLQLPIRIGSVEGAAISMGVDNTPRKRPLTHDFLASIVESLGAKVRDVVIARVQGTTFFARVQLERADGEVVSVDARPSDAIALAVRVHAPIFADGDVLDTAALPDFKAVEKNAAKQDAAAFHDFIEGLYPDDFVVDKDGE